MEATSQPQPLSTQHTRKMSQKRVISSYNMVLVAAGLYPHHCFSVVAIVADMTTSQLMLLPSVIFRSHHPLSSAASLRHHRSLSLTA